MVTNRQSSRRNFLKQTGCVLAGATVLPQSTIAINTAPKKVRIGVVGGGFGTSFQWHEHPDCVVQAVSDLREDRRKGLMKVYNCPTAYNSLEELVLAKDIDDAPYPVRVPLPAPCKRALPVGQ